MKFYMLDGNEKILCAVPSKDIISLYQNLNYHQADTIEGSLVLSEKYTSILSNVRYFAISDRESNHNFYLYRKTLVQVQNHEIAINGQGAFWDEMQGAYIKDRRPNQVTPADAIKLILGYSRWNVDYVDQMLEEESLRRDMNFYYVSLLDALNTVYQTWQVDIEPYINIEGHQITRRYVKLYQQQGGNNGRRFVYGDNALTVTQQANEGSIFTALVGRGAGVEETDADGNLTGGYSRKINFADVEWSKANGDPCDKPKGQEYVEWKESTELYGYSDGKPRIGIVNFDNEKDPAQLLKETWAQLQQVGVPLVQFQATVGDVGYLNLGETVTIVRYDLNIKYQTRVTGIKWNRCDEAKSQITIGVKAIQSTADKIAGLQQSVAQANVNADEAKSTANHAIIDGTGAVVNYGPNEPTNPKEGDIWYDVQPDGTVVLKQYQNGQWVILIDDTTGQQIKNKVEAQQKELDQAVQDANAASAKADGLVAQIGDANTNAQKALTTAHQNEANLGALIGKVFDTADDVEKTKNDLQKTEQDLQGVQADFSNIKAQAQAQGKTIIDIQKKNDSLSSQIADVKGDVSGLRQTADTLQASVQGEKNDIASIKETAGSIQSTVASIQNAGENLIVNSDFEQGSYHWKLGKYAISSDNEFRNHKIVSLTQTGLNSPGYTEFSATDLIPVHAGQTISIGVWIKASDVDSSGDGNMGALFGVEWYPDDHSGRNHWNDYWQKQSLGNHDWQFLKIEGLKVPNDSTFVRAHFFLVQNGTAQFALPIMVYGDKLPAWSPSPLDSATATDMSTVEQTVDGLKSVVQSHSGQISQVQQTSDMLQSTVTKELGSYLQNGNFDDKDISKYWVPWDTTKNLNEISVGDTNRPDLPNVPQHYLRIATKSSENKTDIITKDYIPVNINEGLEVRAWSYLGGSNNKTAFQFYVHCYDKDKNELNSIGGYFRYDNLKEWEQTDASWKNDVWGNKNIVSVRVEVVLFGGGIDTYGAITGLKIINGSNGIASQFTQTIDSLESKIADTDGNISQLKQTADSLNSLVGNANNDISSLKQRADSMESNISDNKNDISDLRQTANSLQSNIQSKADISQITQLSNAIQSEVQSIGPVLLNGTFDDNNFKTYYIPWDITKDYSHISINSNAHWLDIFGINNDDVKYMYKYYMPVVPGTTFTYSGSSKLNWGGGSVKPEADMYIHFYDANKNEITSFCGYYRYDNNDQWYDFSESCTVPDNAAYARIESRLQLRGCSQKTWLSLDDLKVSDGVDTVSSKISQMADDINLRVQKGDLISQINIQAGKTLISSNNLYLDASTVVFSGNAFIPSAAITDLSADKITAGTLNAGNVNIINLDVNKLVGNTTEFVRSGWTNAYGSHVQIDGGGMAVSYGDWYTRFDGNGMTFKEGDQYLGGFQKIGMEKMPPDYQGLSMIVGGDAEFMSINAQDYGNDSQNPIPEKLIWMREGINGAGYNPGWNFCDDVWMDKVGINSIEYSKYRVHFVRYTDGSLGLINDNGYGVFWSGDGYDAGFVINNALYGMKGTVLITEINSDGTAQKWDQL